MLSRLIEEHRQNAILVNGNGPVGTGLFVEVRSVDREGVRAEELRRKRVDAGHAELRAQLGNRREQVPSRKDDARRMSRGAWKPRLPE